MANVDIQDLKDFTRKGYIEVQDASLKNYQAKLHEFVKAHLSPGKINADAFKKAVIKLMGEYDITGITRTALTNYVEPIIRNAKDVEKGKSNALSNLYGLIGRIQGDIVNSVTEETIREGIAKAKVTNGTLDYFQRLEDLARDLVVDIDSDRLIPEVIDEFRRKYL